MTQYRGINRPDKQEPPQFPPPKTVQDQSVSIAESVWCPNCQAVQPATYDYLPANEYNAHAATDIVCNACLFIVATLHHVKSEPNRDAVPS